MAMFITGAVECGTSSSESHRMGTTRKLFLCLKRTKKREGSLESSAQFANHLVIPADSFAA